MDQVFPEKSKTYRNLDVAVLHSLILEKILGIDKENMAQQINLTYTPVSYTHLLRRNYPASPT